MHLKLKQNWTKYRPLCYTPTVLWKDSPFTRQESVRIIGKNILKLFLSHKSGMSCYRLTSALCVSTCLFQPPTVRRLKVSVPTCDCCHSAELRLTDRCVCSCVGVNGAQGEADRAGWCASAARKGSEPVLRPQGDESDWQLHVSWTRQPLCAAGQQRTGKSIWEYLAGKGGQQPINVTTQL